METFLLKKITVYVRGNTNIIAFFVFGGIVVLTDNRGMSSLVCFYYCIITTEAQVNAKWNCRSSSLRAILQVWRNLESLIGASLSIK